MANFTAYNFPKGHRQVISWEVSSQQRDAAKCKVKCKGSAVRVLGLLGTNVHSSIFVRANT